MGNELSEVIAERWLLDKSEANREVMVDLCNRYSYMSLAQIDEAASKIDGLRVSNIPTNAMEVGVDKENVASAEQVLVVDAPRSIAVLLDRSASMCSRDANGSSRFDVCRDCITDIFEKKVDDHDFIGLYTFENHVCESFPLTEKGPNHQRLASLIRNLPAPDGLTRFYDGVQECLQVLQGSSTQSKMLRDGIPGLNLIVITCGSSIKPSTQQSIQQWTNTVQAGGSIGMYIPAERPAELVNVFAKVADIIGMDGDGECES